MQAGGHLRSAPATTGVAVVLAECSACRRLACHDGTALRSTYSALAARRADCRGGCGGGETEEDVHGVVQVKVHLSHMRWSKLLTTRSSPFCIYRAPTAQPRPPTREERPTSRAAARTQQGQAQLCRAQLPRTLTMSVFSWLDDNEFLVAVAINPDRLLLIVSHPFRFDETGTTSVFITLTQLGRRSHLYQRQHPFECTQDVLDTLNICKSIVYSLSAVVPSSIIDA